MTHKALAEVHIQKCPMANLGNIHIRSCVSDYILVIYFTVAKSYFAKVAHALLKVY